MSYPIQLFQSSDNRLVDATLTELTAKHLNDFETFWQDRLQNSKATDAAWDWLKKERIYGEDSNYEKYAIECNQITQGLMMIEVQRHRSQFDPSSKVVYVDYLATAPWNRISFQDPPQFKSVGSALLKFARYRSHELGYRGLVGLHSLPESETFYQKRKMINCGRDPEKENLTYFEWYQV